MKISELMSRPVYTCRTTDTLDRAAALMWEHDIGTVAVVDAAGELVGMVTDRDACMASYTRGLALGEIPAEVAMSKHVVSCIADDSDAAVAQLMAKHKIRRVPVVDESRRPVGMVSLNDLARTMARGREVPASSVAGTLAAISEHRQPDGRDPKRASS
jgi:CBS domain-containing protein